MAALKILKLRADDKGFNLAYFCRARTLYCS